MTTNDTRTPVALTQYSQSRWAWACIAIVIALSLGQPAQAAKPRPKTPGATIVINGDPGGSVRKRYNEVQDINRLSQRVEIRKGACLSSCTMFLGAADVCVSPQAILGFHGPSRLGYKLASSEFEAWSRVIAAHYPTVIRQWYMEKARHSVFVISKLRGAELIRLGIPQCT